jgi:tetratricopeptide (TPR) repeat protein
MQDAGADMSHHSRHERVHEVRAGYWSSTQAYVLAVITLLLGLAVGYLVRGSAPTATLGETPSVPFTVPTFGGAGISGQQPRSSEFTARTVEPLLQQLQSRPDDADLLINIANTYYDGQDYAKAIEYYQEGLKIRPKDVNVRTDMATAMWYSGDADGAIKQYEQSLKFQPTHAQTLFNMGIVMWQGKKDGKRAIQLWNKLLTSNPSYPERAKVDRLVEQVKNEGSRGSPSAQP